MWPNFLIATKRPPKIIESGGRDLWEGVFGLGVTLAETQVPPHNNPSSLR